MPGLASFSFAERIRGDLTAAVKSRQTERATTLRLLLASCKNAEIGKRAPLTDDEFLAQVQKAIKQRREAIDAAQKGGRDDIRQKEEAELRILEEYLPAQLGEEDLAALVAQAIEEAGARSPADMGKVMKVLMPKIAGRADGAAVSRAVRQRLALLPAERGSTGG